MRKIGSSVLRDSSFTGHLRVGDQRADGSGQAAAMTESASAFLATLTSDQRAKIIHPLDDDAARTNSGLSSGEGHPTVHLV